MELSGLVVLATLVLQFASLGANAQGKYLYPFTHLGPSVQYTIIKEAAIVAKFTKRTLILPPIFNHYRLIEKGEHAHYSFEDCFDLDALRKEVDIITIDALRERGWSGKVDNVVYFKDSHYLQHDHIRDQYIKQHVAATGIDVNGILQIGLYPSPMDCSADGIITMATYLGNAEVAGLMVYGSIIDEPKDLIALPSAAHNTTSSNNLATTSTSASAATAAAPAPISACTQLFFRLSAAMQRSKKIHAVAHKILSSSFAPGERFIALQIRPTPDSCLQQWRKPILPNTTLADFEFYGCETPNLYIDLPILLRRLMRSTGVSRLFLAGSPEAMDTVTQLIRKKLGVGVVHQPRHLVASEFGQDSAVHHQLVEQEICVKSAAFLTVYGSMGSSLIIQERLTEDANATNVVIMPGPALKEDPKLDGDSGTNAAGGRAAAAVLGAGRVALLALAAMAALLAAL